MSNGTTETGGSWTSTDSLLKIGVGLLAGALAAYALFELTSTSEEPPIRVKNGSMELQILSTSIKWKQDGSLTKWKVDGGSRTSATYTIDVKSQGQASCTNGGNGSGTVIKVTYSDNASVAIQSNANHTRVTASANLVNPNNQLLLHTDLGSSKGYIQTIEVDGHPFCRFYSYTDLVVADLY
jgi:hypothetical protein